MERDNLEMDNDNKEICNRRKTLNTYIWALGVFFILALVLTYITWLINPAITNIPAFQVEWLNSYAAYYIVSILGYWINSIFLYSIIFKVKLTTGMLYSIPGMILWPFLTHTGMIMTTLVPFLVTVAIYVAQIIYKHKKGISHGKPEKWTFKTVCLEAIQNPIVRFVLLALGIGAYQYVAGLVKLNAFKIGLNILTTIDIIMYSIDLYIIYALLYILTRKEEMCYALEVVLWKFRKTLQSSEENLEQPSFSLNELNKKQKLIFLTMAIGIQLLQFLLVGAIGLIQNAILELSIILVTLIAFRTFILRKTLHATKLTICTFITCAVFWALLKLTPPLGVSIFLGVVLTASFALGLYLIATILEDKRLIEVECNILQSKYDTLVNRLEAEKDDLSKMTEEELTAYCTNKGLDNIEITIVINKIIHKKKNVDILPIIGYEKTRFYEIRKNIIEKGIDLDKK